MGLSVKIRDNSIAVGEQYEDGRFVPQYEIQGDEVNTEQKVLAWVHQLCPKQGMDVGVIKTFIECCESINPKLDIDNTGV